MMHIVFVHTPMPTISVHQMRGYWQSFDIQYHSAHPGLRHMKNVLWELPHWIPWLAGVLSAHGFTSIEALDFYTMGSAFDGINRQTTHSILKLHPADVFLFSPMTANLQFAYEIAEDIKLIYPRSIVIFGGVVATPLNEEVARHPSVDYVVVGRGEIALPALLNALRDRTDISLVGNLTYKTEKTIWHSSFQYPSVTPAELAYPRIDLFPPTAGEDIRYIRQVYGLGCPYACEFCTIQTIGQKPNYFPISRILSEIRAYREYYGPTHNIYWGDETFTLNASRTITLCEALKSEGGIYYDCQTRLNALTNPVVITALSESGCKWIEIGIESGDQDTQNLFKQHVQLAHTKDILARLRDAGIAACSYLVNGFPNQTLDQMKRSIDWVASLIADDYLQASYLFGLVPFPGSALFGQPDVFGMRLHHRDLKYYNEELPPVFDTRHGTSDQIYRIYLDGLGSLTQAMRKAPVFGPLPDPSTLNQYGEFWNHN
jgi:anaerobic magnesium-protoporphyrin IX monomethyl ester cyclase